MLRRWGREGNQWVDKGDSGGVRSVVGRVVLRVQFVCVCVRVQGVCTSLRAAVFCKPHWTQGNREPARNGAPNNTHRRDSRIQIDTAGACHASKQAEAGGKKGGDIKS